MTSDDMLLSNLQFEMQRSEEQVTLASTKLTPTTRTSTVLPIGFNGKKLVYFWYIFSHLRNLLQRWQCSSCVRTSYRHVSNVGFTLTHPNVAVLVTLAGRVLWNGLL